jgi:hypothetical protein
MLHRKSVKHSRHTASAVDSGSDQQADFIEKSCL